MRGRSTLDVCLKRSKNILSSPRIPGNHFISLDDFQNPLFGKPSPPVGKSMKHSHTYRTNFRARAVIESRPDVNDRTGQDRTDDIDSFDVRAASLHFTPLPTIDWVSESFPDCYYYYFHHRWHCHCHCHFQRFFLAGP